jgi:hypothetical protein
LSEVISRGRKSAGRESLTFDTERLWIDTSSSLRSYHFVVLLSGILVTRMSEPRTSASTVGNVQARLGNNAINYLFSVIVVQRMQSFAPAHEVAAQEIGLVAYRVFLVLGMVSLQNEFTLIYESTYSFCILH